METENKLIAEFMGAKVQQKPDSFDPEIIHTTYNFLGHPGNWRVDKSENTQFTSPMLCYDVDWSWLMPVVEKIENLEGIDRVDIFYRNCQITYSDEDNEYLRGGKDCRGIKGETKLQSVYVAVVEFIKWFNTITPNIYYED